jgi:hypothetical protein
MAKAGVHAVLLPTTACVSFVLCSCPSRLGVAVRVFVLLIVVPAAAAAAAAVAVVVVAAAAAALNKIMRDRGGGGVAAASRAFWHMHNFRQ